MLIAEDLLLLVTDDASGKLCASAVEVDLALGAANLVELVLNGRIGIADEHDDVRPGRIVVRDASTTGDDVLDDALDVVSRHPGEQPAQTITRLRKHLRRTLDERLAAAGVLAHEQRKLLGIITSDRWPVRDTSHETEVRSLIARALVDGETPDQRTAALIGLLHALGCEAIAVDAGEHGLSMKELRTRAEQVAGGEWAPEALRRAIREVMVALAAAVAAPVWASAQRERIEALIDEYRTALRDSLNGLTEDEARLCLVPAERCFRSTPLRIVRGLCRAMVDRSHSGQTVEGTTVGTDDRAAGRCCGRCDDQVVGTAGSTGSMHCDQQARVPQCDGLVVGQDRNRGSDLVDVRLASCSLSCGRQHDTDGELGESDCCNSDVVIVFDEVVQIGGASFGVDEEGGVEQEERHGRVSTSSRSRTSSRSLAHRVSGRCRRRSALASAPRPRVTGSMWATALPRRVMVYRSPACSTASRRSANLRAASVAVTSGMKSDYQITRRVGRASSRSRPRPHSTPEDVVRDAAWARDPFEVVVVEELVG
jgi:hypothetical protein